MGKGEGTNIRTLLERNVGERLGEVEPDLRLFDFGIKNGDVCALGKEIANECDGGGFAGVTRVGFECKAEDGNVLPEKENDRSGSWLF